MVHISSQRPRRAFTIIELLVVVSIIALLIGILLPAISRARDQARQTGSLANLRNLGTAHASYASEWNDRQITFINDQISSLGTSSVAAMTAYHAQNGNCGQPCWHPGVNLGWGYLRVGGAIGDYVFFNYYQSPPQAANHTLVQPITFQGPANLLGFGSFRLANARQFNQYVSGKFYDKVFYAPKDTIVNAKIEKDGCFEDPGEFCYSPPTSVGDLPAWSSYVLSPAGMYAPEVLQNKDKGGFRAPWTSNLPAAFRAPAMGQARFPSLKTHMLEHHWLQNRRADCNPGFTGGAYGTCEPFYFNHGWESAPVSLFYDGHTESVGTRDAIRADGRMSVQMGWGTGWGLWSRDTTFGADGYFIEFSYDQANTSYHVLTTDGILGRDFTGN